ncbi:hypothetical protein FTO74_13800 [Granulicella sp. WH15]|uniref:PD40 domain-containing protein n=1 Tax=Granulicella sp. WH15 TaxID=2602070 RepID=UPI001366FDC0|nr:PD40 domain-containing protein [Granulicella sp. WH15]QHN04316.1 hypothetical protein FTO74_13800 [Granulicella sp. WH15]
MALEIATERDTQGDPLSPQLPPLDVDPFLVREQLTRILGCVHFKGSARISRFLQFVTETVLEGRADEIKETSIGVSVYDRVPTYDPKVDTVVRSEARRLRRKLDQYFEEQGHLDRVRISLPKGGYVPVFTRISVQPSAIEVLQPSPALPQSLVAPQSEPVHPEPVPRKTTAVDPPHRRTLLVLASLCLAILLTGLVALFLWHRRHSETLSGTAHISPLTSFPGESYQPSISPDGRSVAFIWNNGGPNFNVYVMQPGGRPLRVTTSSSSDLHPVWSRDGSSLAFLRVSSSGSQVMLIPFPGGSEKVLFTLKSGRPWSEDLLGTRNDTGPSWSADGKKLIVSDIAPSGFGLGLYEYSLGSHELRPLTDPLSNGRDLNPVYSPDGRWVAYVRFSSYDSGDIFLTSLSDRREHQLTAEHMDIQGLAWSDDSHSILFSSNRDGAYALWKIRRDGGPPAPMETTGESAIQPAVSSNGSFIVYADWAQRSNILKVALQHPASSVSIAPSTRRSHSAQFSPDGSKIAFVSDRSGKWELWVANADGKEASQLTRFEAATVGSPRWSPDGRSIAFDARPKGHSAVYVVSADGQLLRNLSSDNFEEKQPAWSQDGKWLYFDSNRAGPMQLWKMRVAGTDATPISSIALTDVHVSPDSQVLFFTNSGEGLWKMPANGGAPVLVEGLERCRFGRLWTVTDRGIYFVDIGTDRSKLQFYDFRTQSSRAVLMLPNDVLIGFPSLSYSATENAILFSAKEDQHSDLMTLWEKNQK